jgi:hypothetical protein
MNSAAHLWKGTADEALELLRAEWIYLNDRNAALLLGRRVVRDVEHAAKMAKVPGGHVMRLGILLAKAPESKRARIAEEFGKFLSVEDAAKMRGVAWGSMYCISVWIDQKPRHDVEMQLDERGAQEMAEKIERNAFAGGAMDVRVQYYKTARRAA